jgi:hypothetical protein
LLVIYSIAVCRLKKTTSIRSVSGNIWRHSDKELPPKLPPELPPELPPVTSRCCCYHLALDSAQLQPQLKIKKEILLRTMLLKFLPLVVVLVLALVSALLKSGATHT